MDFSESIDAAISAHMQWKKRLLEAIDACISEYKVETVAVDNVCQFGQWLYGLPLNYKNTDDYKNIVKLHAEFHKTASGILAMALAGKKEEALTKLDFNGEYSRISGKLVLALKDWQDKQTKK